MQGMVNKPLALMIEQGRGEPNGDAIPLAEYLHAGVFSSAYGYSGSIPSALASAVCRAFNLGSRHLLEKFGVFSAVTMLLTDRSDCPRRTHNVAGLQPENKSRFGTELVSKHEVTSEPGVLPEICHSNYGNGCPS